MADIDRFMSKVKKLPTGCWEWQAYKEKNGYGKFGNNDIPNQLAHRWSYWYHKGMIHPNLAVCHSCDNPSCVNPQHLWLGTSSDNMKDMVSKNRHKSQTGSNNNYSKLTEVDVQDIKSRAYFGKAPIGGNIKDLAEEYNVSYDTIRGIARGVNWTHV